MLTLTRRPAVTVDQLVDLWFDDEHTPGTRSPQLVKAVAQQVQPKGLLTLAQEFYPGVPWPEIPVRERSVLEQGFGLYRNGGNT